MNLRAYTDAVEDVKELVLRPATFLSRRMAEVYGTAILTTGVLCMNLYAQPTIIAPCSEEQLQAHTAATTNSATAVPLSSVLSAYVST